MNVVRAVRLQLWDPEELQSRGVDVNVPGTFAGGETPPGSLSDPRLGAPTPGEFCGACGEDGHTCPGHFGHIDLAKPVYNIFFMDHVVRLLKKICLKCAVPIQSPKQCPFCSTPRGKIERPTTHGILHARERLSPIDVRDVLRRISAADCRRLGWACRPEWAVPTVLAVPPPCVRPASKSLKGAWSCHELTYKYSEIIKANNRLKSLIYGNLPPHILDETWSLLQWHVSTLFDNSIQAMRISHARRDVPMQGIKQRLLGKEGRIRGNLMGKRVDFSARTVISADPLLDVDEVGVPRSIAANMTVPMMVNRYNMDEAKRRIARGPLHPQGARYLIRKDGKRYDLKVSNIRSLVYGDILERPLQNGDLVAMNRQPTLHRMSIMGHRVRIMDYSTFRLNLSVTTPYNADFDGDEMNLHVPQTLGARAELEELMGVKKLFVTPQSNRPVMGIIQDSLLGAFLFTRPDVWLTREELFQCLMHIDSWEGRVSVPAILKPTPLWSGKQVFSIILPDIYYSDRGGVNVRGGDLLDGTLTKTALGQKEGSIIHKIFLRYGAERTATFFNAVQKLVDFWLLHRGFSTGIGDCIADKGPFSLPPGHTEEVEMNRTLNRIRDSVGLNIKNALSANHGMKCMADAGSKGSMINMSQIAGCVGQQNVQGKRIADGFRGRTLPHFARGENAPRARGFIEASYFDGLGPCEFFFHAMAGREGLIDTACKTATTGYTERRLVKSMENFKVEYDWTVRDSWGNVIQFRYGDDGYDAAHLRTCRVVAGLPPHLESGDEWTELLETPLPEDGLYPVDIEELIWNAVPGPSRLDPRETVSGYSTLFDPGDPRWNAYVLHSLSWHRMVFLGLGREEVKSIVDNVRHQRDGAMAPAGEMVGVLAAQSIAEPATQMTLNTFHFTGVSSKDITLGVPRLLELLNCTRVQKTPSMTLHPRSETVPNLESRYLRQHVDEFSVRYGEIGTEAWLGDYVQVDVTGLWVVKWSLRDFAGCLEEVARFCRKSVPCIVLHSGRAPTGPLMYIIIDAPPDAIREVRAAAHDLLDLSYTGGLVGVTRVFRDDGGTLETEGVNLYGSLYYDCFDHCNTVCNDIHATLKVLGIEAARQVLIREVHKVISFDGSYINIRHILLLADAMTHLGHLSPITRNGFHRDNPSVLSQCTFEKTVHALVDGALKGQRDPLAGVSENIIMGNLAPMGSGMNTCLLDMRKLEECIYSDAGEFEVEEIEEIEEIEQVGGDLPKSMTPFLPLPPQFSSEHFGACFSPLREDDAEEEHPLDAPVRKRSPDVDPPPHAKRLKTCPLWNSASLVIEMPELPPSGSYKAYRWNERGLEEGAVHKEKSACVFSLE